MLVCRHGGDDETAKIKRTQSEHTRGSFAGVHAVEDGETRAEKGSARGGAVLPRSFALILFNRRWRDDTSEKNVKRGSGTGTHTPASRIAHATGRQQQYKRSSTNRVVNII